MNQKSKISDHKKKVLTSNDLILLCLAGMGALFLLIFAYFPMFGLILAFKDGDYALNLLDVMLYGDWTLFGNFSAIFNDPSFLDTFVNTLLLNLLMLVINFPAPIIFAGIYSAKKATYGYLKGTDKKRTPVIDEETAPVVRRIFELYAAGTSPKNIADILNAENIPSPGKLAYERLGHKGRPNEMRLWCEVSIRFMLNNIMYIGHLPMLQETTVSYKNHKRQAKDRSDWVITYNNHEPIIPQELWDRVQERQKHMAQGRKTKSGFVYPLSGFLVCADCGSKLKMSGHSNKAKTEYQYHFNCGLHLRYGKTLCFSHYIPAKDIEAIVLNDIRTMAQRIVLDEKAIREDFIRHNAELADKAIKTAKKELQGKRKRTEELSRLMQVAYEDRLKGKMPEDICISFIQKYSEEQKRLETEIAELEGKLTETVNTIQSADEFIRNIKKYLDAPELTREMCYELLDCVVVGGLPKITGKERVIDIVYKVDIASVLRYKLNK